MKASFPLPYRKPFFNKYTIFVVFLLFIIIIFVFPFSLWFEKHAQPFSCSILVEYFKYNLNHFPISDKQLDSFFFFSLYIGVYIFIDLIHQATRLIISPEKIYYSFFNIPFRTAIERKNIDYCQFGLIKITQNKFTSFLQRPIFNTKTVQPEEKLYFFPLKTLQLDLDISSLQEDKKLSLFNYSNNIITFKKGFKKLAYPQKK